MSEMSEPERLWTLKDVSDYLRVPVGTIYQWRVRRGGPPAMRIGRYLRFDPESVKAWSRAKLEAA